MSASYDDHDSWSKTSRRVSAPDIESPRKNDAVDAKTLQKRSKFNSFSTPNDEAAEVRGVTFNFRTLLKTHTTFDAANLTSAAMKTFQKFNQPIFKTRENAHPHFSAFPVLSSGPPLPLDDFDEIDVLPIEDESEILNEKDFSTLSRELPKRLVGSTWTRSFCTSRDGFSLATVYRKLASHLSRPALLVIRDSDGHRFGAFVSESFRLSEKSFGSGESFVFRFREGDERLQVWKWTCKNDFFVLCSNASVCVGIDDGKFSIFLDENLFHGRTQKCRTFDNEPLTPKGDFQADVVEVWNFY